MPPPIRRTEDDYHFHTYDFLNAQAWQATTVPNHGDFYSLVADLEGLRAFGVQNGVPNIDLDYGPPIDTGGRRLMTLRFGNPQQPAVLITGGIHAREWIAPEMVYLLAEYLVANYTTAVATPYQRELRQIVDSRWIHITPMLNPNGNHFTVFQDSDLAAKCLPRQWRKNLRTLPTDQDEWEAALTTNGEANPPFKNVTIDDGNECSYDVPDYDGVRGIPPGKPRLRTITPAEDQTGVDLARNFSTQAWGYDANPDDKEKTSSQSRSESYFGPAARSEAETAYVESYVDRLYNLRTSIDYHAYGQYIVYPSEAHHRDLIDGGYRQLGVVLGALIGPPAYTLGTPKSTMGYDATGTPADYINQSRGASAFVIELSPQKPPVPDKGEGFKLPENRICSVFEANIRGALALIAAAGTRSPEGRARIANIFRSWNVSGRGNRLPA